MPKTARGSRLRSVLIGAALTLALCPTNFSLSQPREVTTSEGFSHILDATFALDANVAPQIQIDKPKPPKPLPNPELFSLSRDEIVAIIKQILETREIPLDKEDCNPTTGECLLLTKPVIFIKGISTRSQLEHYCDVPAPTVLNWTKGRYVLRFQVSPTAPKAAQAGVYAKFEGWKEDFAASEWLPLGSRGVLEDTFLRCIQARTVGADCKDEGR